MVKRTLLGLVLVALASGVVSASTTTYILPSLNMVENLDPATTFTGNGYVGQYSDCFTPILTFENDGGSTLGTTLLQQNISGLYGKTITHATLDYYLNEGDGKVATIQLTSFTANGTLSHSFLAAPDNLGQITATSYGLTSNSIDVTSLLADRVDAGADWFGLHISMLSSDTYHWSWLGDRDLYPGDLDISDPDAALVRLCVDYTDDAIPTIPVPGAVVLGLIGSGLIGLIDRRRAL